MSKGGPILNHCSAGVGRSGTCIALDMCCQLLEANSRANPLAVIQTIREDRVALVQHKQQYELLYAGCELYAEFVEANLSVNSTAEAAPVTYSREGW